VIFTKRIKKKPKLKEHKSLQPFSSIELFYGTNHNRKISINSLEWSTWPNKIQNKITHRKIQQKNKQR